MHDDEKEPLPPAEQVRQTLGSKLNPVTNVRSFLVMLTGELSRDSEVRVHLLRLCRLSSSARHRVRSPRSSPPLGHGATLNVDGEVELDAIIMDGKTLSCGAVSSVKNIANPVTLARAVMDKTSHVMLSGKGASLFAESIGVSTVPTDSLVTEYEKREWEKHKHYMTEVMEYFNSQWVHDTVGAVAVDCAGNVACATSTGGIRNKMVGRVGDSPVIGCGGYADNFSGAVSCTGHGESILKVTLARLIIWHIEQGKSLAEASQLSLQHMGDRVRGVGGAVVVSPSGKWAATFTSQRMAWAAAEQDVLWFGLNPNETLKGKLSQ
ncbi:isoaspartyl peptidase/L-asparaginase [Nematolebias whitei]|uniref:isoaspartyl peptidase/L-asparaginase n=1 Tax=Nematolebias whitei TaxID=451745 RepID=UPI001897C894|nr:isoaspartyl peptidase/L-asparaginase [Nematolebias whitei]